MQKAQDGAMIDGASQGIRSRSEAVLIGVLIVCALLFAYAVWPTLYRYDEMQVGEDRLPVRINRFTGRPDILSPSDGRWPLEGD